MADIEKTKTGIYEMLLRCSWDDIDKERHRFQPVLNDALELLKAQQPKKGSWDYGTQCSVCKGTIIPPKGRKIRVNFCPWCGADMRGEQK